MSRRVLLVEDNDDQRKLLAALLREAGLEPIPAWRAEDGLSILEDCACDLAIFDVQLPGMSGLSALGVVAEKWPSLPVLLVTACGDIRESQALALGARAFLRKPLAAGSFLAAVREALAGRG